VLFQIKSSLNATPMDTTRNQITATAVAGTKPMATVGAGRLASMIWKDGDEQAGWRYRFNVFRTSATHGRVSQLFSPSDVVRMVKLAHVLAAVIADDGCLAKSERDLLKCLTGELEQLWTRISAHATDLPIAPAFEKGAADGDTTCS
jgi:hypothetical protein